MRYIPAVICIAIATCLIAKVSSSQNFDTGQIKTYKMSETIYMLEGSGGNIGLLTGKDGAVMIDDQFAPLSEKIKTAIKQVTDAPVRFVINTHFHGDHVEAATKILEKTALL